MTEAEFDAAYDAGKLDAEYAEYIMEHSNHHIGNGHMLTAAMERGDLYDDFRESMTQ